MLVAAWAIVLGRRCGGVSPDRSHIAISCRRTDADVVLLLAGQMLLDDGDLAFGRRISDLINRDRAKIVLDPGGLTYIDSSGVGMIVFQQKALRQRGGDMKLLHLNRRAETLFGMLKLLIAFERFEDEAAAVRSFA